MFPKNEEIQIKESDANGLAYMDGIRKCTKYKIQSKNLKRERIRNKKLCKF